MEAENTDPSRQDVAPRLLRAWVPALAFLLAALGSPVFQGNAGYAAEVKVAVDFPTDGSSFAKPVPQAIIAGHVRVHGLLAPVLDLAIVIDQSGSTVNPAGVDINGNGTVGRMKRLNFPFRLQDLIQPRNTDPGDSVLAAELAGARNLLSSLDLANARVSIIGFSEGLPFFHRDRRSPYRSHPYRGSPCRDREGDRGGDPAKRHRLPGEERPCRNRGEGQGGDPRTSDAHTEQSLSADPGRLQKALTRIETLGPRGNTNMAAAIREATAELLRDQPDSPARPGAKKVMLLLSDGFPSSPVGSPNVADPEDVILALRAAYLARKAGIEIHTYALGPRAVSAPFALTEIARITRGRFHPISDPSQIVYRLKESICAQLESLVVKNATLDQPAGQVALGPEGAYIAVVPVKAGINQIEVTAMANDGTRGGASVLVNYLLEEGRDSGLQPTKREMALGPGLKSFDELLLELEQEKKRWLELDRKTKELELKAGEKGGGREQLDLDLKVKDREAW